MNLRTVAFLSVALLLLLVSASTAGASDVVVAQEVETEVQAAEEPVEIFVTLEEPSKATTKRERKRKVADSQHALINHIESKEGVRVLNSFWISNTVLIEVEPGYNYRSLTRVGEVRSLKPNTKIEALGSVTSPSRDSTGAVTAPTAVTGTEPTATSTPYGIKQVNAQKVWSQHNTKGGGINVAVLDTGVNVSHPDIELRTTNPSDSTYPGGWAEFDAQGNRVTGSKPYDSHGHGTHVSGTVVGDHTGVAPNANLMHGLIIRGQSGTLAQALSGVEWAIENDADVVSMSIGGGTQGVWADVAKNANDMGVVLVSSVGNNGAGTSASPGNVYDVISVGAVDRNLNVAGFSGGEVIDTDSTWGNSALDHWPSEYVVPNVVSAGVQIKSTNDGGGYSFSSGTSMAAPHVAGATALALSASGDRSPEEVREAFDLTAFGSNSEEPDTRYGQGAADALAVTNHLLDGATVSGTVVDGSGATVSDAEVRVNGVRVDDTNGGYDVGLAQGSWSIEANAPGYNKVTETVNLGQGETVKKDIVLGETKPAFFEVSNLNGPSSTETDGSMTVSATVTNTGDVSGTEQASLRLGKTGKALDGKTVKAAKQVTLGEGTSKKVKFTVGTPDSEGSYVYGVFTGDSSATGTLTAQNIEPAFFGVTGQLPNKVETGDSIAVTATVTNTGDVSGTKDVTYRRNEAGKPLDTETAVKTKSVSIGAGQSKKVGFSVTAPTTEGSYRHGVFTGDNSVTGKLNVQETAPAFFDVSVLEAPETAETEEEIEVNATVTNTGDVSGTQDVTFRLNGTEEPLDSDSVVDSKTVGLGGGASTTVDFTVSVPENAGEYAHGIFSDDDSETENLTIEETDMVEGVLSDRNPFGNDTNNPVGRNEVIGKVVNWNLNGTVDSTSYTRKEIIDFVVEWNLARQMT